MSDELTAEQIEQLKARDERFRMLDESLAIEHEIANSKTIQATRDYLKQRAERALEQLAAINPTDWKEIAALQVDVQLHRTMEGIIKNKLQLGQQVIRSLEDERAPDFDLPSEE